MQPSEIQTPFAVVHQPSELKGAGWINARQAAFQTRRCAATIRRACRAGHLRHIRVNHPRGAIRTRSEWVEAWKMRGIRHSASDQSR